MTAVLSMGWRKWSALGAATLAVVAPVQSIRTERAGAELEQRLAQLRAQGEPIAPSELAPQPIPDEANAATYYKLAFEKLTFKQRSGLLGTYVSPDSGADRRALLEPRLRELIRQNEEVFPLIEKATEHPLCLFYVDLETVTGGDWSRFQALESVLGLVMARAMVEAKDGDMNAAVGDALTGLRVARAMDTDPLGFSFLSGLTNRSMAVFCLHAVSQSHPLTYEQAKALFDELGKSSVVPAFERCVKGQRALYNYYFTLLRGGRENLPPQDPTSSRSNPAMSRIYDMAGSISAAQIYSDQIAYLDLFGAELKLINEPYGETAKTMQAVKGWRSYSGLTWWGPGFDIVTAFSAEARISVAQTTMALAAYKSKYGCYPKNLGLLESKLGWKLPVDPYTKLPLRYRVEGKGFAVYSLGRDMKDDGGANLAASVRGEDTADMGYARDD